MSAAEKRDLVEHLKATLVTQGDGGSEVVDAVELRGEVEVAQPEPSGDGNTVTELPSKECNVEMESTHSSECAVGSSTQECVPPAKLCRTVFPDSNDAADDDDNTSRYTIVRKGRQSYGSTRKLGAHCVGDSQELSAYSRHNSIL